MIIGSVDKTAETQAYHTHLKMYNKTGTIIPIEQRFARTMGKDKTGL